VILVGKKRRERDRRISERERREEKGRWKLAQQQARSGRVVDWKEELQSAIRARENDR